MQFHKLILLSFEHTENNRQKKMPSNAFRGFTGFAAFYRLFSGFEFVPFRRRVSSLSPVTNAGRWAVCPIAFFGIYVLQIKS
jgi:hypothetical protein